MVDVKVVGLLATILAAFPTSARAGAEVAAQIQEAERLSERAHSALKAEHYAEAEGPLRSALRIREAAQGQDHLDTAKAVNNLAFACMELGKREEAKALYRRSLAIREKALGPDHAEVARGLCRLALAYASIGDREEQEQAVDLARRGVATHEKALGPDHPDVADSWDDLASVLFIKARRDGLIRKTWFPALSARPATGPGSREEALAALERAMKRAVAARERAHGPDDPGLATPLNNLGVLYAVEGRYAEAAPILKRAVALAERTKGPDDLGLASDLEQYAAVLGRARKDPEAKAEAKAVNARARAIRDGQVRRASADAPRER